MSRTVIAAVVIALAAHIVVFGWRVLTVERRMSSDSYSYISVARNILAGDGLVLSAPGFNQQESFWTQPFELGFHEKPEAAHNVGYSFLIFSIGAVSGLGLTDAALLVSIAAYVATLLLTYHLAYRLGGRDPAAGLLAVAIAFHLYYRIFLYVWTEPVSIAALLAMTALLAAGMTAQRSLAAGTLAGAALLVRTAMLPMVALGILAYLVQKRGRLLNLVLFITIPAASLVFATDAVRHQPVREESLPTVVFGFFWLMREEFAVLAILGLLCLWLYRKDDWLAKLIGNKLALLLVAWVAGYSLFFILAKWQYDFEFIARIASPLEAVLVLLYGALFSLILRKVWEPKRAVGISLALLAASTAFVLVRDRYFLLTLEHASNESRIAASERLEWVRDNIKSDDLVIGMDTMDLPYYYEKQVPTSVTFSPIPPGIAVSGRDLVSLVFSTCGQYDNHYLLLRKYSDVPDLRDLYGSDVGNLAEGRLMKDFELIADLADGSVYRMNHCESL